MKEENAKKCSDSRDFRTFCFNFVFHHNKLSLAHSLLALIMIKFVKVPCRLRAMRAVVEKCLSVNYKVIIS